MNRCFGFPIDEKVPWMLSARLPAGGNVTMARDVAKQRSVFGVLSCIKRLRPDWWGWKWLTKDVLFCIAKSVAELESVDFSVDRATEFTFKLQLDYKVMFLHEIENSPNVTVTGFDRVEHLNKLNIVIYSVDFLCWPTTENVAEIFEAIIQHLKKIIPNDLFVETFYGLSDDSDDREDYFYYSDTRYDRKYARFYFLERFKAGDRKISFTQWIAEQ